MSTQQKAKGFTIIEVVLVLAIAGLIFLMVFLALPALQRSQRDTQRRSDVGQFASQINQYQSNNSGSIPTVDATIGTAAAGNVSNFVNTYMTNWKDPQTGATYVQIAQTATATPGQWKYYTGRICDGEAAVTTGANARNFSIVMKLEGAGSLCQDNK